MHIETDGEVAQHEVVPVEELAEQLREEMGDKLKSLLDMSTQLSKEEKAVWNTLDSVETQVKEMNEQFASSELMQVCCSHCF